MLSCTRCKRRTVPLCCCIQVHPAAHKTLATYVQLHLILASGSICTRTREGKAFLSVSVLVCTRIVLFLLAKRDSHKREHQAQVRTDDVVGDPLHELRHAHRRHRRRMKNGFLVPLSTGRGNVHSGDPDSAGTGKVSRAARPSASITCF